MASNIDIAVLVHLLIENGIITKEEGGMVLTITSLKSLLIDKGLIKDCEFDRVDKYYSQLRSALGQYIGQRTERLTAKRVEDIFKTVLKGDNE